MDLKLDFDCTEDNAGHLIISLYVVQRKRNCLGINVKRKIILASALDWEIKIQDFNEDYFKEFLLQRFKTNMALNRKKKNASKRSK